MDALPFHAYIDRRNGTNVVVVAGELDMASAHVLRPLLADAEADDRARLVLDLGELTFIDVSGLHVIEEAADRAGRHGRPLTAVPPRQWIKQVFEITGVAARLEWLDDRAL